MEDKEKIEELRNRLNLEIRSVLAVMDMIDLEKKEYEDYVKDLSEEEYLNDQIKLVDDLKDRLVNIFKD